MREQATELRPLWLDVLMAVLVIVPVVVTPTLAMFGAWAGTPLFGDTPAPSQARLLVRLLSAAFLVGTVLPLIGFLLTFYTRQLALRLVFAGMLLAVLVFSAVAWVNNR